MTGLVRMARSGGGFSAPVGDKSGEMLAESSPAGSEPVLEGRCPVGGPQLTV